jgi:transcription termination/antitermination protein NusG
MTRTRYVGGEWYALSVKHQHEKSVRDFLQTLEVEALLPFYRSSRQWSDRTKELDLPLFPGYVFARFPYESRLPILRIPSVTSIVGFGGTPAPVAPEEIAALRLALDSKLPLRPWPLLKTGDRVRIERGPLKGVEGILLKEKDCCRLVIGVELLQRSVAVEVSPDLILPLRSSSATAR